MTVPAIPPVMTEEGAAHFRKQGFDVLPGRETRTWRAEWKIPDAIRDLVQNSLDSVESFSLRRVNGNVVISDDGMGFDVHALLLGQPKPKPEHFRGRFGEGLKIASLVFIREGYGITFETEGKGMPLEGGATLLRQRFAGVDADVLAFLVRKGTRSRGTEWVIHGYSGSLYEDRFIQTWSAKPIFRARSRIAEPVQRLEQIFAGSSGIGGSSFASPAGRIHIRDIYVKNEKTPFSYNLWDLELAPDRHALASERSFLWLVGVLWSIIGSVPMAEWYIRAVTTGDGTSLEERAFSSFSPTREESRAAYEQAWRNIFGDKAVLSTNPNFAQLTIHEGFKLITVPKNLEAAFSTLVTTDKEAVLEARRKLSTTLAVMGEKSLTGAEAANLKGLRLISKSILTRLHTGAVEPRIEAVRYPDTTTLGHYAADTETVGVSITVLGHFRLAMDTFIHEYAHFVSGADDGSEKHTTMISTVGAYIAQLALQRLLDPYVYGPDIVW